MKERAKEKAVTRKTRLETKRSKKTTSARLPRAVDPRAAKGKASQTAREKVVEKDRKERHLEEKAQTSMRRIRRNPTDGSFAVLAFQLAAFTKYLNEVFLSY